jgi:succinoglycan biosynthesis transport protein ExoP
MSRTRRMPLRRSGSEAQVASEEAYRVLRSNIEVVSKDLARPSVLVTSPNEGEGKTTTAVNLALAVVHSGRRVVLVDMDLRRPDTHRRLGTHGERGVTDILTEREPIDRCLQFIETDSALRRGASGLYFLPAGPPVANPAELIGTNRTARLLEVLAQQADLVLIDGPPVLPVADALELARHVGGVVIVAEAQRTTFPEVHTAAERLSRNQATLLGVVLNRSRDAAVETYGSGEGTY